MFANRKLIVLVARAAGLQIASADEAADAVQVLSKAWTSAEENKDSDFVVRSTYEV
jgi:hypothetical protein